MKKSDRVFFCFYFWTIIILAVMFTAAKVEARVILQGESVPKPDPGQPNASAITRQGNGLKLFPFDPKDRKFSRRIIVDFKDDSSIGAVAQQIHQQGGKFSTINKSSKLDELNVRHKVKHIRRLFEPDTKRIIQITAGPITPDSAVSALLERKKAFQEKALQTHQKHFQKISSRINTNTTGTPKPDLGNVPYLGGTYVFELGTGANADAACSDFAKDPDVKSCQPDIQMKAFVTDQYFSSSGSWGQPYQDLWGLHRIGTDEAWKISKGEGITVAVVDTGVDYYHEDLQANIWHNTGEIPGNNIDDDGNGYVDDDKGFDFSTCTTEEAALGYCAEKGRDNDPMDDEGHGTHVAGTIAAVYDNGTGIAGIAPKAKIMPVKALGATGIGWTSDLADAIVYAVDNGAQVINNSWGCDFCSRVPIFEDVVKYANAMGSVNVFAAGNSSDDLRGHCPGNMRETIAVGAIDELDQRPSFSSYGSRLDIVAPGAGSDLLNLPVHKSIYNILSLRANGTGNDDPILRVGSSYIRLAGTSMATPHVSGAVALLRSLHPEYSPDDVKQILRVSATDLSVPGFDSSFGFGLVNTVNMLKAGSPLKVKINQPADWSDLTSSMDVNITAKGTSFANYRLLVADEPLPLNWKELIPVSTVAADGKLAATLKPDDWEPGWHSLKLRAQDTGNKIYEDDIIFFKPFKTVRENTSPGHQIIDMMDEKQVFWRDYSNYYDDPARPVDYFLTDILSGNTVFVDRESSDNTDHRRYVQIKGRIADYAFWTVQSLSLHGPFHVEYVKSYVKNIKTGDVRQIDNFDILADNKLFLKDESVQTLNDGTTITRSTISFRVFDDRTGTISNPAVALKWDNKIWTYYIFKNHLVWENDERIWNPDLQGYALASTVYFQEILSGEIRKIKQYADSNDGKNYYLEQSNLDKIALNERYIGMAVSWKRVENGSLSYGNYIEVYDMVSMTSQKFYQPLSAPSGVTRFLPDSFTNAELFALHQVGIKSYDNYFLDLLNGTQRVVNKYVTDSVSSARNYLADSYIDDNTGSYNWSVKALEYHPVEWVENLLADVVKTSLVKSGAKYDWDAGAASAQFLSGDCGVRFTVPATDKSLVLGFSENNTANDTNTLSSILYGIYLTDNGLFSIVQHGFPKTRQMSYKAGDTFIIERINGNLTFRQNGKEVFKLLVSNTKDLLVDAGLYTPGARVDNVSMKGFVGPRRNLYQTPPTVPVIADQQVLEGKPLNVNFQLGNFAGMPLSIGAKLEDGCDIADIGARISLDAKGLVTFNWTPDYERQGLYTVRIFASNGHMVNNSVTFKITVLNANPDYSAIPVKWVEAKGVQVQNSNIVMNSVSAEGLPSTAVSDDMFSGNGGVDFKISTDKDGNTSLVCGLTSNPLDPGAHNIDYGLHFHSSGAIFVVEQSRNQATGSVGTWKAGDVFSIKRNNEIITYWQNGNLLFTSPRTSRAALMVAASLSDYLGSGVNSAQMYGYMIPRGDINHAPVVTSGTQITTVREGQTMTINVSGNDAENSRVTLTVKMKDNSPVSSIGGSFVDNGNSTGVLTITPPSNMIQAQYQVVLTGTDPSGKTDSENIYITILDTLPPDSTRPSVPGDPILSPGGTWVDLFWQESTDNIGVAGYYLYRNNIKVATVNSRNYRDTGLSLSTTYKYKISAFDDGGNVSAFSNEVSVTTLDSDNMPPFIKPFSPYFVDCGTLFTLTVDAVDPNDDKLTYAASNLPAGAVFDPGTHVFSWRPNPTQEGTYQIEFSAQDPGGLSAMQTLSLTTGKIKFGYDVNNWINAIGVSITKNNVTRTADPGISWGDAGVASAQKFPGRGGMQYTFDIPSYSGTYAAVGLSAIDKDKKRDTILHGFYLSSPFVYVFENGVQKYMAAINETTGTLAIRRIGNNIYYTLNNKIIYQSTALSDAPLLADLAIEWKGASVKEVKLGGYFGDMNFDGVVNIADLAIFKAAYGSGVGDANYNPLCDLDGNGKVNAMDLSYFKGAFGTGN